MIWLVVVFNVNYGQDINFLSVLFTVSSFALIVVLPNVFVFRWYSASINAKAYEKLKESLAKGEINQEEFEEIQTKMKFKDSS